METAELLLKASASHLTRVKVLTDLEWKMAALYWAVNLTSASGLVALSATLPVPMLELIAHSDWMLIIAYYVAAGTFLFGFSANLHRPLVTERNRYQLLQDRAMELAGEAAFRLIADRDVTTSRHYFKPVRRRTILDSAVWGAKVISTTLLVSGVWIVIQVVAHETIAAKNAHIDRSVQCAFLDCGIKTRGILGHPMEAGTSAALLIGISLAALGVRAFYRGRT